MEGRRERRGWRGGEIGRVEGRKGRVGGEERKGWRGGEREGGVQKSKEREREGCRKVRRGKEGGRKK